MNGNTRGGKSVGAHVTSGRSLHCDTVGCTNDGGCSDKLCLGVKQLAGMRATIVLHEDPSNENSTIILSATKIGTCALVNCF